MAEDNIIPNQKEINQNAIDIFKIIAQQDEKTRMTVLLELIKHENLQFITEYPTVNYTKAIVKLETWRQSLGEICGYDINHGYDPTDFESDDETIIKTMIHEFMIKMTSHKGNRAKQIITALKESFGGYNNYQGESGEKGMRRTLFGRR